MARYITCKSVALTVHTLSTLFAYLLVSAALSHQATAQCGPPGYTCSSTSTSNYTGYPNPLIPIFSSSNVVNDTNVDTTLNPSHDCYTVLATTGVGNVTRSGGANDVDWSRYGTYVMLEMLDSNSFIYHITTTTTTNCPNGAAQVENPTSYLRPYACKKGSSCSETMLGTGCGTPPCHPNTDIIGGEEGFDRGKDNVFYFMQNYTKLWQMTIKSDTSITSKMLFDFAQVGNCPEITASTPPAQSGSSLSIIADGRFGVDLSFTGGQGTATQYFVWDPTLGCALFNAATGNWYNFCASNCSTVAPSGTETVCYGANNPAGHGFHNVQMSLDGNWALIANDLGYSNGTSSVCTSPPTTGFFIFWQVATGNIEIVSGHDNYVGHPSFGHQHTITQFYPAPNIREYPTPTSFTQFFKLPSPMGNEIHGTWTHSGGDDVSGTANVWINLDSNHPTCCGIVDLTPVYLNNEIFALFPNATYPPGGTPIRFGHTFKDENTTSFGCLNSISNTSQDGRFLVFGTSMLGQWSGCGAAIVLLQ